MRAMLIQQMGHTWRYSIGNPYEELSFAEGTANAEVMAEYGLGEVAEAIVGFSITRLPKRYTSWRAGAQLLAQSTTFELTGNRKFLEQKHARRHAGRSRNWRSTSSQAGRTRGGSPRRRSRQTSPRPSTASRLSSSRGRACVRCNAPGPRRGTRRSPHARAGSPTGSRKPSARAVRRALVKMPDGSLFLPFSLTNGSRPYQQLSATRMGSYWNLVVPYALASGFFKPGSCRVARAC